MKIDWGSQRAWEGPVTWLPDEVIRGVVLAEPTTRSLAWRPQVLAVARVRQHPDGTFRAWLDVPPARARAVGRGHATVEDAMRALDRTALKLRPNDPPDSGHGTPPVPEGLSLWQRFRRTALGSRLKSCLIGGKRGPR